MIRLDNKDNFMTDHVMFYIGDQCFAGKLSEHKSADYPGYSFVIVPSQNEDPRKWSSSTYRVKDDQLIYLRKDK